MPLVVPGITPQSGQASTSSQGDWLNKLAGKKLGDKHDETVSAPRTSPLPKLDAHTLDSIAELCKERSPQEPSGRGARLIQHHGPQQG